MLDKSKAPGDQPGAKRGVTTAISGVHQTCHQSISGTGQNGRRLAHIMYAGDWYPVPAGEAEVWQWLDRVGADTRLSEGDRLFAGVLAGLLLRAIRTGEGVTYR